MKYLNAIIIFSVITTNVYAAPEDFIGNFKGTEKTTVTNCGAYNGTTTGAWSVKHFDLKANTFIGSGSNQDGDFTVTGEAIDNTASGTVKGINKWKLAWNGEFKAALENNKYTSTTTGSVSSGCKFTSEIEATKTE